MSTSTTNIGLVKPAPGEKFSRSTYNNNLDLTDGIYPRLIAAPELATFSYTTWGAPITPGSAMAGKNMKMLTESVVATTDANGYFGVTMPYTFQNGYAVVGMVNGDDWARPTVTYMVSTNIFTNLNNKFYVRAIQNGSTPLNAVVCRMNYIVVGY